MEWGGIQGGRWHGGKVGGRRVMAPIRSEATVAAAPAVTRSGRKKKPSQTALRAGKPFTLWLLPHVFSLFGQFPQSIMKHSKLVGLVLADGVRI